MFGHTELRHKPLMRLVNGIQIDRYRLSILVVSADHSVERFDDAPFYFRPSPQTPELQIKCRLERPSEARNCHTAVFKNKALAVDQD